MLWMVLAAALALAGAFLWLLVRGADMRGRDRAYREKADAEQEKAMAALRERRRH